MLDQKVFGEKLRNHRKKLGMTQEEVAEKVGVSPQAISKWESGDCLPDCFNLKGISDVYKISADVLLETESDGDIDAVASKIEQLPFLQPLPASYPVFFYDCEAFRQILFDLTYFILQVFFEIAIL